MHEEPGTTDQFNRTLPAIIAAGTIAALLLYHWYAMTAGRIYFFILFGFPTVTGLAIGGLIHPPILYGLGRRGRHLPASIKALSVLFVLGGLAFSFYLALVVYRR